MVERLIDTKRAAELLGVTQARIRQLIKAERLAAQRIGNSWMIVESDLQRIKVLPLGRPPKKDNS